MALQLLAIVLFHSKAATKASAVEASENGHAVGIDVIRNVLLCKPLAFLLECG